MLLRDAVAVYGDDWVSISAYIAGRKHSQDSASQVGLPVPFIPSQVIIPIHTNANIPEETAVVAATVTTTTNSVSSSAGAPSLVGASDSITPILPNELNNGNLAINMTGFNQVSDRAGTASVSDESIERLLRTTPNAQECAYRWNTVICPNNERFPPWSQEEVQNLLLYCVNF